MKKIYKKFFALAILLLSPAFGQAQSLLHYWNFNDVSSQATMLAPSQSAISGAGILAISGGIIAIDPAGGNQQNFDVLNLNAQNQDAAGTHLRFNDPIGGSLVFSIPSSGHENAIVKFATKRSGSGAGTQIWEYSVDGVVYLPLALVDPNNGDPALAVLDLSAIDAADDNANLKLKVSFIQGGGGTVGNNRFDNFTMHASAIGGLDTVAPAATFFPASGAANVSVTGSLTLSFNENVRLIDNSPLTNSSAASVIVLKKTGTQELLPFTASFADNAISVTPNQSLENAQSYELGILPDAIEDFSNNPVAASSSIFTTIAVQTPFAAGDLAVVAYRMNATGTEDEIAILSFVDILPGTFFTITDSKYTTNSPAQCANGLVWTASIDECIPAGSVISIQTDSLIASKGTISGSGFGLSSNGDQLIIYSGSNSQPTFITALSSNGWAATNTSCSGSVSMIPATLTDGLSATNTATVPGSVSGNSANAYYYGTQTGILSELKTAVRNPANWTGSPAGTAAQQWPNWNFPSTLQVQEVVVLNNTTIRITFNAAILTSSAQTLSNYSGIPGLASALVTGSQVTLTYSQPFAAQTNYDLVISEILDLNNQHMACAFAFSFNFDPSVAMATNFMTVEETAGSIAITLLLESPVTASVDLVLKSGFGTADNDDFSFAAQTLSFTGTSNLTQTISIPILDDSQEEQQAEYFVLSLENPVGMRISGNPSATIYIKDNDLLVPQNSGQISLNYVGSFDPSGTNSSTCEIVVHDAASQRLFTTSAIAGFLDIIDFSDPTAPLLISSIDMNPYGGVTSVAVKNGIVAVASPNADAVLAGSVVFFTTNGVFQKQLSVGVLPDMICFTPDGTKVLTANEGQPNSDYSIDPEGSVSVIDISGGIHNLTQSHVTTMLFTAYNSQEAALVSSGVRKLKLSSTMSQDFEPEFISIAANSQKAWVTLQENNAVAAIDLANLSITDVWALGTKDISLPGNGYDISDNNEEILIANWPIHAYYTPDAIAGYVVNGTNYLVTANEGDEKEYDTFEERTTVGAASYLLDETLFPNASVLKQSYNMGRFRVTNLNGNLDSDANFEQIYAVGARSFSIFNADSKQLCYDSGDDFERITADRLPNLFNTDHEDNVKKGRSRAKGPEPEGVTTAKIGSETYAFVSLERVGGVMVYDITNPQQPVFATYGNNRSTTSYSGDHGPEGITYIPAQDSPDGMPYLLVANEISGTITIYEIEADALQNPDMERAATFAIFPNPSHSGVVYFNRQADVEVFDLSGKMVLQKANATQFSTEGFASGIYLVKTNEGIVKKLIVK